MIPEWANDVREMRATRARIEELWVCETGPWADAAQVMLRMRYNVDVWLGEPSYKHADWNARAVDSLLDYDYARMKQPVPILQQAH